MRMRREPPFPLTPSGKLPGRAEILARLESLLAENPPGGFGVVLFSIDRFQFINSRYGHAPADTVLERVGAAAKQLLRHKGLVGRWGGDEFLCLLTAADGAAADAMAEQLRARIADLVIPLDSSVLTVTCSFGAAAHPDNGADADALLAAANAALLQARQSGRNRVVRASGPESRVFRIGGVVETALREERIMPAYQPIFDLVSGRIVAEEALARIVTTGDEVLAADEFIDAASQLQLTHKIDRAVVAAVLRRCAAMTADDRRALFVNVSGDMLRRPELVRELLETARTARAAEGGEVVLEITERELLGDPETVKSLFAPFVEHGFKLALDDFGSGYSSFQYLADLPVSFLKIDGRLIQRLHESRIRAIVRGIQNTARELGLITLAEYVEQERQANILREMGVNWAQGHYFSKAAMDEKEAGQRRSMSVNWAQGYYYRRPGPR